MCKGYSNWSACMSVCLFVVVGTKNARSQDLDIYAFCEYNKSVDIGENLVSVHFKLLNVAATNCACLWVTDHTHFAGHVLMMRLRMLKLSVGTSCQVIEFIQLQLAVSMLAILHDNDCRAHGVCALSRVIACDGLIGSKTYYMYSYCTNSSAARSSVLLFSDCVIADYRDILVGDK